MAINYGDKTIIKYNNILSGAASAEFSYFYNQAYYSMTKAGYKIKDIFNIYKKYDVCSAKAFVEEFATSNNLNSAKKNELIALFKSKGAKL